MIAGFALQGRQRNVIGIDASFTPAQTRAQVLDIARNTSALIGGDEIVDEDVIIEEDYAYPAYGVPSQETLEAIRLSARLAGMITRQEESRAGKEGVGTCRSRWVPYK